MMKPIIEGLTQGLARGLLLAIVVIVALEVADKAYTSHKAIKECEKSLPRDQKCIIIAKPLLKQD